MFSHPSGKFWDFGNGIIEREIAGWKLEMRERMKGTLAAVDMMVTLRPRRESSFEM